MPAGMARKGGGGRPSPRPRPRYPVCLPRPDSAYRSSKPFTVSPLRSEAVWEADRGKTGLRGRASPRPRPRHPVSTLLYSRYSS